MNIQANFNLQAISQLPKTFGLLRAASTSHERGQIESIALRKIMISNPTLDEMNVEQKTALDKSIVDYIEYLRF